MNECNDLHEYAVVYASFAYSYSYTTAYTELSALFSLITTGRNNSIVILYDYWCDFTILILHDYKK